MKVRQEHRDNCQIVSKTHGANLCMIWEVDAVVERLQIPHWLCVTRMLTCLYSVS